MKVRTITKNKGKPVIGLAPSDSLDQAVTLMMEHRIGSLVVMENEQLVGILSERDLLTILHDKHAMWIPITVSHAMTENPIVCHPDNTLEEVMQ